MWALFVACSSNLFCVLFTSADGVVALFDVETSGFITSPITHKGVTRFCVNEKGGPTYGLCLAAKRKLALYQFSRTGRTFRFDKVFVASGCPHSRMTSEFLRYHL